MAKSEETLAGRLAAYAEKLTYRQLPDAVVHEVKRRVVDSLGCAFGAWNAAPCRIARDVATSVKVPNGSTVWGTGHRTLPDLAAFANGAMVRYLDFNDTYLSKEPAHPSDNLSAVLAAAESAGASGVQVIEALALAYEIHCRLCDAAALRPRGWDHVTYGPITAALGAAKVWRQPATKMTHAVNLAAVANIALRQTRVGEVSMWKACAFSNAARNGVMAATLARSGMTGPAPIFEGEKGFMKLVSGPLTLGGLGGERDGDRRVPFKILDTYIKHYPVEYHAQTAVEAALLVRDEIVTNEGPKALQTIAQVTIGSYDVAIEIIGRDPEKWRPATRETADHSFPYCVAVALLDGTVTLDSFAEKRIKHPAVHRLMERVKVVPDPEYVGRYPVSLPTRITVKTASGKQYTKERPYPLGHPREAMSDREVEEKCAALAEQHIGASRLRKLLDAVWRLDTLSDIGALTTLMRVRR